MKSRRKTTPKISILIASRNRPEQLMVCLESIENNKFKSYELVIGDQSSRNCSYKKILSKKNKVIYIRSTKIGKAKILNEMLGKARGEVITFTDDDCIVSKDWLRNVYNYLKLNPTIAGVYGKILAHKPSNNKNLYCPSTVVRNNNIVTSDPYIDVCGTLGIGNNMAFRRDVFNKVGNFKEWLGVGSISINGAEDVELSFRLLKSGYSLAYNPKISVYHNRWLTKYAYEKLVLGYTCGEIAFYSYYLLMGDKQMLFKLIIKCWDRFHHIINVALNNLRINKRELNLFESFFLFVMLLYFILRGLIIGMYAFAAYKLSG